MCLRIDASSTTKRADNGSRSKLNWVGYFEAQKSARTLPIIITHAVLTALKHSAKPVVWDLNAGCETVLWFCQQRIAV